MIPAKNACYQSDARRLLREAVGTQMQQYMSRREGVASREINSKVTRGKHRPSTCSKTDHLGTATDEWWNDGPPRHQWQRPARSDSRPRRSGGAKLRSQSIPCSHQPMFCPLEWSEANAERSREIAVFPTANDQGQCEPAISARLLTWRRQLPSPSLRLPREPSGSSCEPLVRLDQ
jgi:hypothetical protein